MKLITDTDYCPVRNFDDVCSLCNCECISGEALTRDCPLIRNGGTPYNPSGDLISRSVVKGLISDKSIPIKFEEEKRGEWRYSSGVLLSDAYKVIDNAPPVDTERPQGEWKHIGGDEWVCSECGHVITTEGSWENPLSTGACHCENCGADMREGGAE